MSKQLLYFEPNSRVTVANAVFENINDAVITESVVSLGNNAVVTLPKNYKDWGGISLLDYIAVGDKVTIELGNDGDYFTEFTGYLAEIQAEAPLVLHFDDEMYPLKRNSFKKTFSSVSLKNLLKYVASDYTIECSDVTLGEFQIPNVSTYRVLLALQQQYGFYSKVKDGVLRCYWPFDFQGWDTHKYKFGVNIKKSKGLTWHRAEDVKVRVKGIANQRNGKKFTYETGSDANDASRRTLNYGSISKEELIKKVEADYKRLAFDGYSGSITGWGVIRTHAGDVLNIIDDLEADREGNYLIEKTIIRYSLTQGFERENILSYKV
jgi:hypothetical protein